MTTLYLSGFSSFEGVEANPTEDVLRFLSGGDPLVPHACVKECIDVLEVSTSAINDYFDRVQVSSNNISIHLGVNSKATTFQLEQIAHNNMTFRVPDVKGFQPNNEPIDDTQELDNMCCTGFAVHDVCAKLKEEGFKIGNLAYILESSRPPHSAYSLKEEGFIFRNQSWILDFSHPPHNASL